MTHLTWNNDFLWEQNLPNILYPYLYNCHIDFFWFFKMRINLLFWNIIASKPAILMGSFHGLLGKKIEIIFFVNGALIFLYTAGVIDLNTVKSIFDCGIKWRIATFLQSFHKCQSRCHDWVLLKSSTVFIISEDSS